MLLASSRLRWLRVAQASAPRLLQRRARPRLSIAQEVGRVFHPELSPDQSLKGRVVAQWQRLAHRLIPLGRVSEGNRVSVMSDGDAVFTAMWEAIARAKHSILLQTYIFNSNDAVGVKTLVALLEAQSRGVRISFVYDHYGSLGLDGSPLLSLLKARGASVIVFNPIHKFWKWRRHVLHRTHMKMLVVDDEVAFTGGMNLTGDYCGPSVGGTGKFRDTHLRVEGPAVHDLVAVFRDSLSEAEPEQVRSVDRLESRFQRFRHRTGSYIHSIIRRSSRRERHVRPSLSLLRLIGVSPAEPVAGEARERADANAEAASASLDVDAEDEQGAPVLEKRPAGSFLQVCESNVWRNRRVIQKTTRLVVRAAREKCYITTPYFLPDRRLQRDMIAAARGGVDVRLLTAGEWRSDVQLMQWASQHLYEKLLRSGVRIFELQSRVLHAKTVSIDGIYASVGTANFDHWSWERMLEVNVTTIDPKIAGEVERHFLADLANSSEVRLASLRRRSFAQRLLHWAAFKLCSL
jgi:cardiolipin synthase